MKRLNPPPQLLNKTKIDSQKGFTLVEIMIVLGIGTAIIALALIVVPTVLRNQRDTARTNAASIVLTQINNWSMRRNSRVPENLNDLRAALSNTTLPYYGKTDGTEMDFFEVYNNVLRDDHQFNIVFATKYTANISGCITPPPSPPNPIGTITRCAKTSTENEIHIITKTVCKPGGYSIVKGDDGGYGPGGSGLDPGNSRTFAIIYALEGDKNIQCIDNN